MRCLLLAIAVVHTYVDIAAADEVFAPAIRFQKRRLAKLDENIGAVTIGSDGRLWRQYDAGVDPPSESEAKRQIESVFAAASPAISGWKLVLLDDSGRAWFEDGMGYVYGYDGRRWITAPDYAEDGFNTPSPCPSRGSFRSLDTHVSVGRITYLVSYLGVHRYDGAEWTYHRIPAETDERRIRLSVSPDGRTAAAFRRGQSQFHFSRGGRWRVADDLSPTTAPGGIEQLVVQNDGTVWLRCSDNSLRRYLEGKDLTDDAAPKTVGFLLAQLGSAKFNEREAADGKLRALAPHLVRELRDLEGKTVDAEVRRRIRGILDAKSSEYRPQVPFARFGSSILKGVAGITADPAGTLYLAVHRYADDPPRITPGLLIVGAEAEPRFLEDPDLKEAFTPVADSPWRAVLTTDGKGAWVASGDAGKAISFFDFAAGRFTADLPDSCPDLLYGVDSEGRVLVRHLLGLAAFDRRYPANCRRIDRMIALPKYATHVTDLEGGRLLAGDSAACLWKYSESEDEWISLSTDEQQAIDWKPRALVFHLSEAEGTPLLDLDEDASTANRAPLLSAHDRQGRRWSVKDGRRTSQLTQLVVEEKGRTLSIADALVAMKLPENSSTLLGRIDGGNRMLISIWKSGLDQRPRPMMAHLEDGRLRLSPLEKPIDVTPSENPWIVNDFEGSLWLSGRKSKENGSESGDFHNDWSARITSRGFDDRPPASGRPWLLDRAGNVWFGEEPGEGTRFQLRRDGRVVHDLELSETGPVSKLTSPQRGSVLAFVPEGLLHLRAEGPDFTQYRRVMYYELGNVRGALLDAQDLGDGWIAMLRRDAYVDSPFVTYLFRLPRLDQ